MLKNTFFLKRFACLLSLVAPTVFLPASVTAGQMNLSAPVTIASIDGDDDSPGVSESEVLERVTDQSNVAKFYDKVPLNSAWKMWVGERGYSVAFLPDKDTDSCGIRSAQVVIREDGQAKFQAKLYVKQASVSKVWHFDLDFYGTGGWWSYGGFSSPSITSNDNPKIWTFDFDWHHGHDITMPFSTFEAIKKVRMSMSSC